jgi:ergothioneine biosynthesis protein EgtB
MKLIEQFLKTRTHTQKLCEPLSVEEHLPQSVAFASPPKWHLAHVTWFFEEMILLPYLEDYKVFDKSYSYLFNSYYNTVGDRLGRDQRGLISKPDLSEVYAYRKYVNEHMIGLLNTTKSHEVKALVVLGINHEQQHQELLITDLKYTFSQNPVLPLYSTTFKESKKKENQTSEWSSIDEGVYEIGHKGNDFCFDNELGPHKAYIHAFEISNDLVTNGEYLEWMEEGAYENFKYWLDEGWAWVNQNEINAPLYWKKIEGEWWHYTLAGLQKINPSESLKHVSYYEAEAFANYKKCRLPTEFEWEVASTKVKWGECWEWTLSAYLPYPKFEISDGAVGEYNGKFMVNQMVLRGASVATSEGHSRSTYRNFFHAQMQWQYSGIRLVKNE